MSVRSDALTRLLAAVAPYGPHGILPKDFAALATTPQDQELFEAAGRVAIGLGYLRPALHGQGYVANPAYAQPLDGDPKVPLPCQRCKLYRTSRAWCVPGTGNRQASIVLVGEGLGEEEERSRQPFVGRAGQLLTRCILDAGLRREELFITNVARCRPTTPAGKNRKPTSVEVESCQFFLLNELHPMQSVRVIVALGGTAAQALLGDDLPPGGITEHQGKVIWSRLFGCWVVVSIHPAYALRKPGEMYTLVGDLLLAKSIAETGMPPQPKLARYHLVRTLDQGRQLRDAILRAKFRLFWDCETNGLHPLYAKVFCYSFCIDDEDEGWVLPLYGSGMMPIWARDDFTALRAEVTHPIFRSLVPKVAHNLKFDYNVTTTSEGFQPVNCVGCTMLKDHIMWNHLPERFRSLKSMNVRYNTGYGRYDDKVDQWLLDHGYKTKRGTPDMGHLWEAPDELVWPYASTDACSGALLDDLMDEPLDARGLRSVYENERIPMAIQTAVQDREGLRINVPKLDQFSRDLAVVRDLTNARLTQLVGYELNINSPKQIQHYLYAQQQYPILAFTETGQPSTREEHLLELARQIDDPVIHLILHGRGYGKLDGTYVTGREGRPSGFRAALDPDGRIRPDTLLHVVETFRLATRLPLAVYTIPRPLVLWTCPQGHGHYLFEQCCERAVKIVLNLRSLIEPNPGNIFVMGDAIQQEYAILAIASHQRDLEEAMFDRGEDAHEFTMKFLTGRTKKDYQVQVGGEWVWASPQAEAAYKNDRSTCKNGGFCVLYLGQAKTLVRTSAKGTPPIIITEEQAQQTINIFYQRLNKVHEWQEMKKREVHETGKSMSLFGDTYRVLPQIASADPFDRFAAERMAVNYPIQEAGYRTMSRAKIRLTNLWEGKLPLRAPFPARVVLTVHDEIVTECPERPDLVEQTEHDLKTCMEMVHDKLIGGCGVPRGIRADIRRAANWGGDPIITRQAAVLDV